VACARALPTDLTPAAIVAVSSGAARGHTPRLPGRTAILHLHGVDDPWVPPSIWAGALANGSMTRDLLRRPPDLLRGGALPMEQLEHLRHELGCAPRRSAPATISPDLGALDATANFSQHLGAISNISYHELDRDLGDLGDLGELTAPSSISHDGYMYDPLPRTVGGYMGSTGRLNLSSLSFVAPATVPAAAQAAQPMRCAMVTAAAAGRDESSQVVAAGNAGEEHRESAQSGSRAPVEVCLFDGGHCLPWQRAPGEFGTECDWLPEARRGAVMHQFVWEFLSRASLTDVV
jgi:hypothetical protein